MTNATEGATAKQGIAANLAEGVQTLSLNDQVTFTKYIRLVLPLDKYVFWVKADLVNPSALINSTILGDIELNAPFTTIENAAQVSVQGSFHYATNTLQGESETEGNSVVTFTALSPVQEFNSIQPNELWVGTYEGDIDGFDSPVTFAFSSRGRYYQAADLYHYQGTIVLPTLSTQLIDSTAALGTRPLIVSNSLPAWLAFAYYVPPYDNGIGGSSFPLYPSFLVPDNLKPPFGVIHIEPRETMSHQASPLFGPTMSQYSASSDRVRVTLYGLTSEAAEMWLAAVLQWSFDWNWIGIMNMPTVRDEKRTAPELNVIAQKKTIDFEVSYLQFTLRDLARQLIEDVIVDYLPQPLSAVGLGPPAP